MIPKCTNCKQIIDFKVLRKTGVDLYCSECGFKWKNWAEGEVWSAIESTKYNANMLYGEWASKEVDFLIRFTTSRAAYKHLLIWSKQNRIRAYKGRKIWTLWDVMNPGNLSINVALEKLILSQRQKTNVESDCKV